MINSMVLGKAMQTASLGEMPSAASLAWKQRTFERSDLCESIVGDVL